MKRYKHHKVKAEMPETSSSHTREQEEHDLAHYIHDRVELMHQVFSVLKYKELKAMAPACVRNITVDDLQELCTEELLGISSKRLCAILDGAEPPSDTESSSQSATEQLETISLDSISSDEEILSQEKNKKRKHKHRRRNSKSKSKHRKSTDVDNDEDVEKSKASRAGLTVLELLELQARARAIRAQLQQEQTKPVKESVTATESTKSQSSEDEVEIKEEPAEVVEISSDEEKPKIEELEQSNPHLRSPETQSKTVTKRVKDLVITVPQQTTQKIKLNRNKSTTQQTSANTTITQDKGNTEKSKEIVNKSIPKGTDIDKPIDTSKGKEKNKEKLKKKKKKRLSNVSDNDEITLQLSDTEKMDLLEDLDRKNYDNVSSDTSSGSESDKDVHKKPNRKHTDKEIESSKGSKDEINIRKRKTSREGRKSKDDSEETTELKEDVSVESENAEDEKSHDVETDSIATKETESKETENSSTTGDGNSQSTSQTDMEPIEEMKPDVESTETDTIQDDDSTIQNDDLTVTTESAQVCNKSPSNGDEENNHNEALEKKGNENDLSEGEISERESSEVEAVDLKMEVVCISDEEGKPKKKKKKKDKKSKKDKKNKKKDFRESSDQNYHELNECAKIPRITVLISSDLERDTNEHSTPLRHLESLNSSIEESEPTSSKPVSSALERSSPPRNNSSLGQTDSTKLSTVEIDLTTSEKSQDCISVKSDPGEKPPGVHNQTAEDESPNEIVEISDEVYELSDDSSNEDETETQNVLSKEPTAAEIEALSAKIDEIDRIDVITDEEIKEYETKHQEEKEITMSWKDRYLDSKKVKRVLNTSNILNALRKKNRQLKKRLEESKVETQGTDNVVPNAEDIQEETKEPEVTEGSIEHYNTLEGSTKFVDPVKEPPITDTLKKDAKQLLKMYKKLLKYNDMSRKKDPTKKKKKKKKEKKAKECEDSVENKESQ